MIRLLWFDRYDSTGMIPPVRFGQSDGNAVDCYIIGFVLSSLQQSIDALEAGSDTGVGRFLLGTARFLGNCSR